ncbi:DUF418 domain-containing protein [Nonomuraea sp. NPDC046802]|uniref:DUF418 domain-containing protein n=1 Tax=Nonomuraea sp. NPDC046802 TaxID=3154919 RepID=UPI0034007D3A
MRAFTLFAGMVAFAVVFSPLWLARIRRGPLKWLVHRVIVLAAPDRTGTARHSTPAV